ncbi:ATPase family protein associated with various cellular activities (AAA) [Hoeflea marina]|uniref:ATPase family protein associated with various cellular activities (AAA) n=1 Tax=Hoeflea marina TaxID=274592 RepID=A0A317PF06_9HYPH|nr:AAA family ATPase [Hoeflea marina]PWV97532.1 ATPase family protein associated with various cellular activities (AAA) [Hoeflea marina]
MSRTAGLTTISEDDIARHRSVAQGMVTRVVVLTPQESGPSTALAGTGRRFVSTVSTGGMRRTQEVELGRTIQAVRADDAMLSIPQHALLFRTRRGIAVALAVAELFSRQTDLETLQARNLGSPLQGAEAEQFKRLLSAGAYVAAFTLAAYLLQTIDGESEPADDTAEPDFQFDTPQDALKALVAGLDRAISGCADESTMTARARAFAREAIEGLISRRARFEALTDFGQAHIRLDSDNFTLDGFDVAPGQRRKPLEMSFKKPNEIIGNHLAKHHAMRLARMIVAYDFERQLNPFVELGGFLFTFIGDGQPGTGKTILIQMLAGLINDYCQMAGYPFHYENFGVDQISSYQGKSGQNCKAFVDNVLNPRAIGFGTIDDIDQVAAKRSDDRASAGQQEVTAVLMESFAGASTIVRGNCTFGMFSNYPENVDDALRQRAGARWLVDGPQSEDDYIDIFALLAGKNHSIPLGEHKLFAGQEIKQAVARSYDGHDRPAEEGLAAVWEHFTKANGEVRSIRDIGVYLHMIKEAEPRFTGRAIKNITDAIKMRSMDIDLPDEWFETPEPFLRKTYDEKTAMISELRQPFSIEMVLQEINRYADSEFRYTDRSDATAVEEIIRRERQRERAIGEIEALKQSGRWGVT